MYFLWYKDWDSFYSKCLCFVNMALLQPSKTLACNITSRMMWSWKRRSVIPIKEPSYSSSDWERKFRQELIACFDDCKLSFVLSKHVKIVDQHFWQVHMNDLSCWVYVRSIRSTLPVETFWQKGNDYEYD